MKTIIECINYKFVLKTSMQSSKALVLYIVK